MGPPKVLGLPNPTSSMTTSMMFGAPSGGRTNSVIPQSGVDSDSSSVRPLVPVNGGSGIGSVVRSGTAAAAAAAAAQGEEVPAGHRGARGLVGHGGTS